MYIAKVYFEDAQDEHKPYKPGEIYPRVGLKPSKDRIAELSSDENIRGIPLIAYVEEAEPEEEQEKEQRPVRKQRKRKNADTSL